MKNYSNLISHKKSYIHFRYQTPPSLQEGLGPLGTIFRHFLQKYSSFLEKLLNNKIFST